MRLIAASLLLAVTHALAQSALPSSPQPALTEAETLVAQGHLDEAIQQLNHLAQQTPEPPGVEALRGKVFYLQNRFGEAETAFASAIKQSPTDTESTQMRGVSLFRLGRPADAIPYLANAHGIIPNTNVDAAYVLALCYIGVHRFDDARHAFAALYGFPPDSPAAYTLAAQMFLRWQNPAAAEQMAHKALDLDPHVVNAHLILGQTALAAANLDQAISEFKQELALNPISGPAYEHLGDALIRKQQYADAQQTLNRAILLEPNATGPFILLGQALLKQNNPGLALSYLEHAEQMDPANLLTHLTLMHAYRAAGDQPGAAREAKIVEDLETKH